MWRETNNCSGKGKYGINHRATQLRIARGEVCNVTVPPCNQTSGFCDCNGDGSLDNDEPWFDCGNKTLRTKGVLCADYCPTVCKFTFYSSDTCDGTDKYSFSLYGAPIGDITSMWHYHKWYKTHNLSSDSYKKWNAVQVNAHGCSLDVFPDSACADGSHDQFITAESVASYHGNGSVDFSKLGGNCTPLHENLHPRCIFANKPCIHPPNKTTPLPTNKPEQVTTTPPPEIPPTCYPRQAGPATAGTQLATVTELEQACNNYGTDCKDYPDMKTGDTCNAADGKYFGKDANGDVATISEPNLNANCHMGVSDDPKCCPTCAPDCSYTIYEDYECTGATQERIAHKGETVLMVANKTGSVKFHGKGCAITFYENADKSGQTSTYTSETAEKVGACEFCVKYACDYLKDDAETAVLTGGVQACQ